MIQHNLLTTPHARTQPCPQRRWAWCALVVLCVGMALSGGCRGDQVRDDDDWETRAQRLASPQERELQAQAMIQIGQGKSKGEAAVWRKLLQDFPKGYYGGRAHTRLGLLAYRKKEWQQAAGHFQATQKHRLSLQERHHILLYHGRALDKLKQDKAIEDLLKTRYRQLRPRSQRKALQLLIKAADRRKQPKKAFRWRMILLTQASGQGQEDLRQSLIVHVKTLKYKQLKPFMQQAFTQALRFPLNYMAMRYAEMLYRKDKYPASKKLLKRLLSQLRLAHPLKPKAKKLLAEVSEVKRPADPLVIGVIIPQSGPGVQIGVIMRSALDLAVQHHPRVRLIYMNSGGLPSQAANAVERLVRKFKAIAIFGPPMPRTALAAAKRAQKLGVPLISITAREGFADIGNFIFRNNLSLSMMGQAVAKYGYHDLRIRRFGVLYPASKYGRLQAQGFLTELKRLGASLTSAIEYPATSDYQLYVKLLLGTQYANGHLLRLNRAHMKGLQAYQKRRLRKKVAKMLNPLVPFEGLFIPEQAKIATQIAAYLAYYNVGLKRPAFSQTQMMYSPQTHFRRIQLLGNNNWLDPALFQAGNKYVRGGIFCVRFYPGSFRATTQNFVQQYQAIHGKPPQHISAFAYDSMRLLAHIASSGKVRNRPQFRRALMATKRFDGAATGPLRTLKNGEITGPIHFLIANKGKFRHHGTLK